MKARFLFLSLVAAVVSYAAQASPIQEIARQYEGDPHHDIIIRFYNDIQRTSNANIQDASGRTLLMYCLQELPEMHMAQLIHPLLLAGLSPHTADIATGYTPLHYAALRNDYRLSCRLLAFGANRGAKDKEGRTPAQLSTLPQLKELLSTGKPVEIHSQRAATLHTKACQGDSAAQYKLAQLYRDESTEEISSISAWVNDPNCPDVDAAESRCWLEQAVAKHYPPAMHELALKLMWGMDGKQDEAAAYELLQQAARAGYNESINFLKENPNPHKP